MSSSAPPGASSRVSAPAESAGAPAEGAASADAGTAPSLAQRPEAPSPATTLSSSQKIAVAIALIAGILVWVLKAWATSRLIGDAGKEVNGMQISSQVSSLAGIILGILIAPTIKDARWTFAMAGVGLLLGAAGPWVWQILSPSKSFFYQLAVTAKDNFAPGLFSFGVSFLVKSAEAGK